MKRRESIPGLGKITMSNQNQFVRQTAAVLLACGLIVSLLPGFAAAQDLSTVEKRAAWLIEQCRGESIQSQRQVRGCGGPGAPRAEPQRCRSDRQDHPLL